MAEDNIYTEQELSKMADELLAASGEPELIPEPPKSKKSSRKKEEHEEHGKSPEERLNELLEKGKKTGESIPDMWGGYTNYNDKGKRLGSSDRDLFGGFTQRGSNATINKGYAIMTRRQIVPKKS